MVWRIYIAILLLSYITKTSDAQAEGEGNANDVGDNQGGLLSPLISVDPALKDSPLEVAGKTVDEIGKLTDKFVAKIYPFHALDPEIRKGMFGNEIPAPPPSPVDAAVNKRVEEEEKAAKDESSGGGLLGKLVGFIGGLLGPSDKDPPRQRRAARPLPADLPKEFDSRKAWPGCAKIIGTIDNQGLCGSCWAISLAHVLSDRYCIASVKAGKTPTDFLLSTTDLMSCSSKDNGCKGGEAPKAWKWVFSNGLVTGGPLGTKNVCLPYPFQAVGPEEAKKHFGAQAKSPACDRKCKDLKISYYKDKYKAISPTSLPNGPGTAEANEEKMMREIMTNGPIQVSMQVYADLMAYAVGIYRRVTGKLEGGHSVRVIGWGEKDGEKFWIVANSWSDQWGEDGFFRIVRGLDFSNIESFSIDFAQAKLK